MTASTATIAPRASSAPVLAVSRGALAKASLAALGVAGAVFVLFVLPAETGIDPTGMGTAIGIAGMGTAEQADAAADTAPVGAGDAPAPSAPTRTSIEAATPWREDAQTIVLEPHTGIELKAHMAKGDSFVFDWQASGGPVKVDMHGEPPNAGDDEFTSYWIDKESTAQKGTFTAPFEGSHGWYWRNKGDTPVTVKVRLAGFYKDVYRP